MGGRWENVVLYSILLGPLGIPNVELFIVQSGCEALWLTEVIPGDNLRVICEKIDGSIYATLHTKPNV